MTVVPGQKGTAGIDEVPDLVLVHRAAAGDQVHHNADQPFGLAFAGAIMLATLSLGFTNLATASTVLSPAEQQQVARAEDRRPDMEQHPA